MRAIPQHKERECRRVTAGVEAQHRACMLSTAKSRSARYGWRDATCTLTCTLTCTFPWMGTLSMARLHGCYPELCDHCVSPVM